jgi:hypothetical protein
MVLTSELNLVVPWVISSILDLTFTFSFLASIGGVLFKVYIVGDAIRVVRRFSLPNVDAGDLSNNAGVFRFPRVSCAAATAEDADLDPHVAGKLPCLGFSCLVINADILHSFL